MDDDPNKLIKDLFAAVEEKNEKKLTRDQISRISLKLGAMLGNPGSHEVTQNEKGQILNEEGLPVFEITEQAGPERVPSSKNIAPPFSADLPLWTLSEEGKARRRAERERILDALEEEERLEEERKAAEEEESRAAKKKRLQAARELQKTMGRTLVKNVKDFKAREEAKNALLEVNTAVGAEESKRLKPKKSVSFDLPPEESPVSAGPQQDWGDVTPARLQPKRSPTPDARRPMKYRVVERFPQKLQLGSCSKDSDDESDPEPVPDSEDEDHTPVNNVAFHSDESTEDGGDFELQEGEIDLNAAQHQREVALAYYEKRERFVGQATAAFSSHSHGEEDPWDQPEVPLDANLTGDRPKPAISKYRADRIVSSTTSLDGLVVPASQSALMRDSVKLGNLEGDQLVGGPEDSDDDLKEIMELIRRGEAENIGPGLQTWSSSQAADQKLPLPPPRKARNEASRFKINRAGTPRPAGHASGSSPVLNAEPSTPVLTNVTERPATLRLEPRQPARSPSISPAPNTPLTDTERSSPKLSPGDIPIITDDLLSSLVSSKPAEPAESSQSTTSGVRGPSIASEIVRERTPGTPKPQPPVSVESSSLKSTPSVVIEPPSFTPPNGYGPALPPMIVDSPDFPPPPGMATMPSMIIDSPDFPPTYRTASVYTSEPLVIDSPSSPVGPSYPGPPRVMSSQVVERSPVGVSQPRQDISGKKVSRFATERR